MIVKDRIRIPGKGVLFGAGSIKKLTELSGRRAFIVADRTIEAIGLADAVRNLLKGRFSVSAFSEVEPDPSIETGAAIRDRLLAERPDTVVAVGGGSVIDACKCGLAWSTAPDMDFYAMRDRPDFGGLKERYHFVAIPTTSGTGSEVTPYSVITDRNSIPNNKVPVVSAEILPDQAIVDPELTASMPPRVTAATGIDALSHALECYTSAISCDYADGFCLQAMRLIFRFLARAYRNGRDMEARTRMANASCLAGMAIANGGTSIVHSLGQVVGASYGVPHGTSMGIFIPVSIEFNAQANPVRYAEVARALGYQGESDARAASWLSRQVDDLLGELGLPRTLTDAGVEAGHFLAHLDGYVDLAYTEGGRQNNERDLSPGDFKQLFLQALGDGKTRSL